MEYQEKLVICVLRLYKGKPSWRLGDSSPRRQDSFPLYRSPEFAGEFAASVPADLVMLQLLPQSLESCLVFSFLTS